jgi:hypothetical protein
LELYKNSIEINKNYYYFTILKKKNKIGNPGRLPLLLASFGPTGRVLVRPTRMHPPAFARPSKAEPPQLARVLSLSR